MKNDKQKPEPKTVSAVNANGRTVYIRGNAIGEDKQNLRMVEPSRMLRELRVTVHNAERELAAARARWRAAAKAMSAAEWRAVVDGLKTENERIKAASIVFWDFVGSRKSTEHQPELDTLIHAWTEEKDIDPETTAAALYAIGYLKDIAERRAGITDNEGDTDHE